MLSRVRVTLRSCPSFRGLLPLPAIASTWTDGALPAAAGCVVKGRSIPVPTTQRCASFHSPLRVVSLRTTINSSASTPATGIRTAEAQAIVEDVLCSKKLCDRYVPVVVDATLFPGSLVLTNYKEANGRFSVINIAALASKESAEQEVERCTKELVTTAGRQQNLNHDLATLQQQLEALQQRLADCDRQIDQEVNAEKSLALLKIKLKIRDEEVRIRDDMSNINRNIIQEKAVIKDTQWQETTIIKGTQWFEIFPTENATMEDVVGESMLGGRHKHVHVRTLQHQFSFWARKDAVPRVVYNASFPKPFIDAVTEFNRRTSWCPSLFATLIATLPNDENEQFVKLKRDNAFFLPQDDLRKALRVTAESGTDAFEFSLGKMRNCSVEWLFYKRDNSHDESAMIGRYDLDRLYQNSRIRWIPPPILLPRTLRCI